MKIGRRRDFSSSEILEPGEYGRCDGADWYGCTPTGLLAGLRLHTVIEHDDGTITVSPSILVSGGGERWHGFLRGGTWIPA